MNYNLRNLLGMDTLKKKTLNIEEYSDRQRRAIKNIKYCANDQWQWVNSYIDGDTDIRPKLLDAKEFFLEIYSDSQENIYDEGFVHFGDGASSYLKDIRFCGKEFLERVCLYYTAKLMEDILPEVEATDDECVKVLATLISIKNRLDGITENINEEPVKDNLIHQIAEKYEYKIRKTRKNEEWVSISSEVADLLREGFNCDSKAILSTSGKNITVKYEDGRKYILNFGKNAHLWCVG